MYYVGCLDVNICVWSVQLSSCNITTIIPQQVRTDNNEDELLFFRVAEGIFVGWFTLEYLVRFLVAPQKADINREIIIICSSLLTWETFQFFFVISFLNIIDLLGILPFYASLVLTLLNSRYSIEYIAKAAQIFRILRILRIFKLSRHITGLKTLGTTLRNSHRLIVDWFLFYTSLKHKFYSESWCCWVWQ